MENISPVEIMMDPQKYGYTICHFCNGYGSSFKESLDRCSKCSGLGLIKTLEAKP